ncbi:hypothetical protein Hamer_G003852 [Homarus americanus]|uniref:Uncharacterized protein n=1 Tax=Homarus americanus TaxID=6706 RepID=A0A8J5NEF9_HOMAM|nr:hypothetical protein Hamer_G003852 [Homarus americanus]
MSGAHQQVFQAKVRANETSHHSRTQHLPPQASPTSSLKLSSCHPPETVQTLQPHIPTLSDMLALSPTVLERTHDDFASDVSLASVTLL